MDDIFDYLRFLIAIALFALGCYLLYDLFQSGFDIYVSLAALVALVMAHYVKHRINRDNRPDSYDWLDALDLILDIPYRFIAFGLRSLWRVGKSDTLDL